MSKEKNKFWRQGDVGIVKIDKLPSDAKQVEHDGILAYGETTGHKHQLIGGRVKYFRDTKGELFFEVKSRFVDLNHGSQPTVRSDGHYAHRLPAGLYKVNHQIEWDWQSALQRRVAD